jgi:DNA repair ATPase RecN
LQRRALAIDEQSYGDQHPNVARDLNKLAQLLQAQWRKLPACDAASGEDRKLEAYATRLAEAEPLMRRALAIFQATYGDDHPHTQIAHHNLAALLKQIG